MIYYTEIELIRLAALNQQPKQIVNPVSSFSAVLYPFAETISGFLCNVCVKLFLMGH